jgi:hypothetical protein
MVKEIERFTSLYFAQGTYDEVFGLQLFINFLNLFFLKLVMHIVYVLN